MTITRNYIVTGGAGFIGSHTVDALLDAGHQVTVVDNLSGGRLKNLEHHSNNSNLKIIIEDISVIDLESSFFRGVDCIIHFAGLGDIVPSINAPVDYYKVNCLGTARIMEAARINHVKRVVYAASSSCYGIAQVPTSEDARIQTIYPYAFTKYIGEQTAFHWGKIYNVEVNSIRIFNAYGTRSRTSGNYGAVFGVFLKQVLEGKPLTIVGNGDQLRDFVYVTDVASAFIKAAESEISGEIFNLGSGKPRSVNEIASILGSPSIRIPERPGEPSVTWANIKKIQELLDWNPTISLEKGISTMLLNLEYWKDAPLWDVESISTETTNWFHFLGRKN